MPYVCQCGREGWIRLDNGVILCKECFIELRQQKEAVKKEFLQTTMTKKDFKEQY